MSTIQSLALTLGVEAALVDQLDVCRKKRNASTYDVAGAISEEEVKAILQIARHLRLRVEAWLRNNHPHLL